MEGERANVAIFILLLFVQSLLKLAVFLETVLLGHLALFLFSLYGAALATEGLQLSVKDLVLAELAFQRTIVYRNLDTWFQTNLLEALFTVRQNPCIIV